MGVGMRIDGLAAGGVMRLKKNEEEEQWDVATAANIHSRLRQVSSNTVPRFKCQPR